MTFFAALMVLSAKTQMAGRNACMPCLTANDPYESSNTKELRSEKKVKQTQKRLADAVAKVSAADAKRRAKEINGKQ